MDCVLFRHGLAVERQEWAGQEQDRPLTDKGTARTRRSAKGLLTLRIIPTHLLSSPLTRSRETAEIIRRLVRPRLTVQICDELAPGAAPPALFSLLGTLPLDSVVFCVGHEPHLSLTAGTWLTGKAWAGLSLKKAGACLIRTEQSVRPANGRLQWWLTAAQLRALA